MCHEEPLFFQSCRLTMELKIQIVVLNVCVQSDHFKKLFRKKTIISPSLHRVFFVQLNVARVQCPWDVCRFYCGNFQTLRFC